MGSLWRPTNGEYDVSTQWMNKPFVSKQDEVEVAVSMFPINTIFDMTLPTTHHNCEREVANEV